jgi:predicted RNase H-like HicB family nuclease
MNSIIVKAEWDTEAQVWTATSDDVPGLVAESASLEKLRPKVMQMIEELIELNGLSFGVEDIPVHFVAQTTERLKSNLAA